MVQHTISKLNAIAPELDGGPSLSCKVGGDLLAQYMLDLIDAVCSDSPLRS